MKRQLFALFTLFLSITLQAASPWDGTTIATSYAGGSGSLSDPFQISSPAELAYLGQNVNGGTNYFNKYFILTSNLDLNKKPWTPIGNSRNAFKGSFDGNSHLISNLNVNLPTAIGVGLFGIVQDAFIKNFGIVGTSTVIGSANVGGIIGQYTAYKPGFSVSGCFSNATVSGGSDTEGIGGIVGYYYTSASVDPTPANLITNCYSTGSISGSNFVAGIVGKVQQKNPEIGVLTISNSYSTGLIIASASRPFRGGIVAKAKNHSVNVTNCYYIDGDGANANSAKMKVAKDMKDAGFVTTLNASQMPAAWMADAADSKSLNNGFPILVWSSQKRK